MAIENPYIWSDENLVNNFMNACARAGVSNSGLCFDPCAGGDLSNVHYLKGVLVARLQGIKPPFNPGDEVRPKQAMVTPLLCKNSDGHTIYHQPRQLPEVLKVRKVSYVCGYCWDFKWQLIFAGNDPATTYTDHYWDDGNRYNDIALSFEAEHFQLVETIPAAV